MIDLDGFVADYTHALLFINELEARANRVPKETRVKIREDCEKFFRENQSLLEKAAEIYGQAQAAFDLCLTRNYQGAGYWDGDLPEELGRQLTDAAHRMGELWTYVGRGGWIYVSP
jgi:hypothetical protein